MQLAMEVARRGTCCFLSKLTNLLGGELILEKHVRRRIEFLMAELMVMQASLDEVVAVSSCEHLSDVDMVWAEMVTELSYSIEDIIDTFPVCVEDHGKLPNPKYKANKLLKKTARFTKKPKGLHRISDAVEKLVRRAEDVARLRDTYSTTARRIGASVDPCPCVMPLYIDVTELIGIEDSREKLISMLSLSDDWSKHPLKTVSIVGFDGAGKTALAKVVYDEIKGEFDCSAFVSVSQYPKMKEVFQNILYGLDKNKYAHIRNEVLEEKHLINKLIRFLNGKRYAFVLLLRADSLISPSNPWNHY